MRSIYALEVLDEMQDAIFLAGPSHRPCMQEYFGKGWRDEATTILSKLGFQGTVLIPEYRDKIVPEQFSLTKQINWEEEAMYKASRILFWIPRDLEKLPGLTTNIEFGEFYRKNNKVIVGIPDITGANSYIRVKCEEYDIPLFDTLEKCVREAVSYFKSDVFYNKPRQYYLSDTHFNQQRSFVFSQRPFLNLKMSDLNIISNWNSTIRSCDTVYFLGDFGDFSYLSFLNFKKMFLIEGNYERERGREIIIDCRVSYIGRNNKKMYSTKILGKDYFLVHEPETFDSGQGFFLYGHIHGRQRVKRNGIDVGVDGHNYYPYSETDVDSIRNAIENYYDDYNFVEKIK